MSGILSKGIKLSRKAKESDTAYTDLANLQGLPDLGGSRDSVEVTTFDDDAHMYINGLLNYGDSIDFAFLYDKTQFSTLRALTGVQYWQVGIPDGTNGAVGTKCTFSGECSVKMDARNTNEGLTYTLSIKPNSEMVWS